MRDEIKPCPFCGIVPIIDNVDYVFHKSKTCSLGDCIFTIGAWNRRAEKIEEAADETEVYLYSGGDKKYEI